MKNAVLLLLISLFPGILFSQALSKRKIRLHQAAVYESKNKGSVVLSLDTIYNKGVPYAILKRKKHLPYYDYTLFSLDNNRLIEIRSALSINRDHTPYYNFFFESSQQNAEVEKYYGYKLEKDIVKYQLVRDNKIDAYQETKFILKFPGKFSDTTIKTYITDEVDMEKVNPDHMYEPVKRNRDAEFYFSEGKIMQDYKVAGRYKIYDAMIRFYMPSGIEMAEAVETNPGSNVWQITYLRNNKTWTVNPPEGKALEELARFLCEKNYL